ncbi:MAG: ribonuclease P protein component [Candidatus Gracilibacteria bacterium]|jgi:ribonuclease P protein component|nr:ribonuclease P protein component [Candidatus Gracilibacteria bacterium]
MISKSFRLTKNDIKYILKKGDTNQSRLFIVKSRSSTNLLPKIAVITSKKLAKKAVIRNKLRRKIYEAFRLEMKETGTHPQKDFIFIAKTGILNKDFWEIKKDLNQILQNEQNKQISP